jgi:hypothetical protein
MGGAGWGKDKRMKQELNPLVVVIVLAVVLIGVGLMMWNRTQGRTFTKAQAHGASGTFGGGR